jgi:two-component system chemotaxis response regulator CheY
MEADWIETHCGIEADRLAAAAAQLADQLQAQQLAAALDAIREPGKPSYCRRWGWPSRVLVADDAIFMRNLINDIFASGGFEVVGEAVNGLEAVEKYRELKPDLTTMDIVMPFKNGIEATRDTMKADGNAVIIVCSAPGQESPVMGAIEAGASDFIVKPFRAEDVVAVVKKVLGDG